MIESHFHHDIDVINARLYEYIYDIYYLNFNDKVYYKLSEIMNSSSNS